MRGRLRFPQGLDGQPLVLPGTASAVRAGFDILMQQAGVRPQVLAEVDDMAMLRLLAREAPALTLVPPGVVGDELRDGLLVEHHRIAGLAETFYAVVPDRRFPHPLVREMLREMPSKLPAPRRSRRVPAS